MKRADVKPGIYKDKYDVVAVISTDMAWREAVHDWGVRTPARPLRNGEKPDSHAGFPGARRRPAMILNPQYVGEENYQETCDQLEEGEAKRLPEALRGKLLDKWIADPQHQYEWEPTVVLPRDLLAPLDKHRRQESEKERQRVEASRRQAERVAVTRARVDALADVLNLDDYQQERIVDRYSGSEGRASVSLEWLEEVAWRLRGLRA